MVDSLRDGDAHSLLAIQRILSKALLALEYHLGCIDAEEKIDADLVGLFEQGPEAVRADLAENREHPNYYPDAGGIDPRPMREVVIQAADDLRGMGFACEAAFLYSEIRDYQTRRIEPMVTGDDWGTNRNNRRDTLATLIQYMKSVIEPAGGDDGHAATPTTTDNRGAIPTPDPTPKAVNFNRWGIGHDGKKWVLFQFLPNAKKLAERGELIIPEGNVSHLAERMAELGGSISKKQATELFRVGGLTRKAPKDVFDGPAKSARKGLRRAILDNVKRVAHGADVKGNPVPWVASEEAWVPSIQIGYAVQEEDNSGTKSIVFKTKELMDAKLRETLGQDEIPGE